MAPGGAGRAVRRQSSKTVAVATVYARRLAVGWNPPGGDRTARLLFGAWRLAPGGHQVPPSDARGAPGGFGADLVREEGFIHNFR